VPGATLNHHPLARATVLGLALGALAVPAAAAQRQDLRSPDTRDAARPGSVNSPDVRVVKVTEPSPASRGIDWGDAGIGAGGVLGLTMLGVGGALIIAQRRHTRADSTRPTVAPDRLR
jgi:hypothetical protein